MGSPSKLGNKTPWVLMGRWVNLGQDPEARTLDSLEDLVRQMRVPRGKVGFVLPKLIKGWVGRVVGRWMSIGVTDFCSKDWISEIFVKKHRW